MRRYFYQASRRNASVDVQIAALLPLFFPFSTFFPGQEASSMFNFLPGNAIMFRSGPIEFYESERDVQAAFIIAYRAI